MRIKSLFFSFCISLLSLILAGCGGIGKTASNPNPTPTPGTTAFSASRFIYGIVAFEAQGLFAGQIDGATQKVSAVPGSPFANSMGQNIVLQLVADPKGRFLYTSNQGASSFGNQIGQPGIGAYQINPANGALTPVPNGKIVLAAQPSEQMAIDGLGRFLYQPDNGSVVIYSMDQGSGMLTKKASSTFAPVGDFTVASNDGRFLFNAGKGLVETASIDQSSGQLTASGAPVPAGGSAGPMAVSHDGRFLYVANETQGNVAVFNVGPSGTLTAVAGSPFTTDGGARGMSLTPDGKFLYVAFNESNVVSTVKGYAVNPAAGTFTAIAGAVVNGATTVTVDGSGKVAYISDSQLSTYTIDPATGTLTRTSQAAEPTSDTPQDMAVTQ